MTIARETAHFGGAAAAAMPRTMLSALIAATTDLSFHVGVTEI